VTADKLKTRKEISSETFVATFVVVFTAGQDDGGFSSVRSLQHEMGVIACRGSSERDRQRTKVEKYSGRVADQEMRNISSTRWS
jgi:hypothetical protein